MLNKLLNFGKPKQGNYQQRIDKEIAHFKHCENVHDLPEIFHYWSNRYLLPKQKPFGFSNPDEFFVKQCLGLLAKHQSTSTPFQILSIGAGNGELEVPLAVALRESGAAHFEVICLDLNPHMLERAEALATQSRVSRHIITKQSDFNLWQADKEYNVIIANQSLHHVLELEHLFQEVHASLAEGGRFLTSDMIGRNGHMRWPEALVAMEPFWNELPSRYKYNQLLNRQEDQFLNHDCSTEGFEGIRAQDILPLLNEVFHFELFIPFANIITPFIDRSFGHNFDATSKQDQTFIDRVHEADEALMLNGNLKPTQMLAALTKTPVLPKLVHPKLTPDFCIRTP